MLTFLGFISGLILLFFGGNWLVKGSSLLAQSINISPLIVGLTVVALGTSAPELLVSVGATLQGSPDISAGNVIGSNIANTGLILGLSGLIYPVSVSIMLIKRQIPIMIIASLGVVAMFQDQLVSRVDGFILVACLVAFMAYTVYASLHESKEQQARFEANAPTIEINRWVELVRLILGLAILMIGAQLTLTNATAVARNAGISELVIGVTLVAVGTSLPELVTSVVAGFRRETDIAIGNVVGSNIFNLLGILGVTALVEPLTITRKVLTVDAVVMLFFTILVLPFVLDRKIGRLEAGFFLACYIAFIFYAVTAG